MADVSKIRWPNTGGVPVCPRCDCPSCSDYPRANGAPRFRCQACHHDFSPTSGTLFAHHKLLIRTYLAAVAIFCNEVKGKSALALSRDLGVQYKTAFVLAHELREAMAAARKGERIDGAGRIAEVDGAYFGGHVRPENRKDRRLSENRNDKRQCVVLICERLIAGAETGRTLATVVARQAPRCLLIVARQAPRCLLIAARQAPRCLLIAARQAPRCLLIAARQAPRCLLIAARQAPR